MLLLGLGIDLCHYDRFKKHQHNNDFLTTIFSKAELSFAFSQPEPWRVFAYGWAAKESFVKALGLSLFSFKLPELEASVGSQQWHLSALVNNMLHLREISKVTLELFPTEDNATAVTAMFNEDID